MFSYYLPYLGIITVELLNLLDIFIELKNYCHRRYTLRGRSAAPPHHPACIPYLLYIHSTSILLLFYFHFTSFHFHFIFNSLSFHLQFTLNLSQVRFESISLPCPFHSTFIQLLFTFRSISIRASSAAAAGRQGVARVVAARVAGSVRRARHPFGKHTKRLTS